MKLSRMFFSTLCLLTFATAAGAKDLCVSNGGFTAFKFTRVKLPKVGAAAPLSGIYLDNFNNLSRVATGTIIRRGDGSLLVGLMGHGNGAGLNDVTATWVADDQLAGTVFFDSDGDYVKDDGSVVISAVACDTLTIH